MTLALQFYGLLFSTFITSAIPVVVLTGKIEDTREAQLWTLMALPAIAANIFLTFPMIWSRA